MDLQWIEAVWKDSLNANINGCSSKYDTYLLKPLHKITISLTGFTTIEERNKLMHIIKENGGNFMSSLVLSKTNVLICQR